MDLSEWEGTHEVWAHDLENAFRILRILIKFYPYVAFDTEFPGNVALPLGHFGSIPTFLYQHVKLNADKLKIIQIGLTLFNEKGIAKVTWQFNFNFNIHRDTYSVESINILKKAGVDFEKHARCGIDPVIFSKLLLTSGLFFSKDVKWLCFQGCADFAYLLHVLTGTALPRTQHKFFKLLKRFCPRIYDIKHIISDCAVLSGGLQSLANQLGLQSVGTHHTAGSDSLLTGAVFFKLRDQARLKLRPVKCVLHMLGSRWLMVEHVTRNCDVCIFHLKSRPGAIFVI